MHAFELRTHFYDRGDKDGKLFARQLNRPTNSVIPVIKKEDALVSSSKEKMRFQQFYKHLYMSRSSNDQENLNPFFYKIAKMISTSTVFGCTNY